ncbi:MAG: tetratricopeptide repeat protein, partial [Tepidisphaeraceae bacterium]
MSEPDPYWRVKELFAGALAMPPEQREPYLRGACGDDATLRRQVGGLLELHENASASGTVRGPLDLLSIPGQSSERIGTMIGPYKLTQQIGEGGFGVVFAAQQLRPVQRRVAIKIIKPGMDSAQVIARFEAERQALALMDHPCIARVLDAGATESGRPFFVMELVNGVPITRYCDQEHLTLRERLELFVPVCQAVQHAHQKGVIHRDLKPSNVLIALYDGRPVPKVIDFGIAKAMARKLTEQTMLTEIGSVVGTLEYMSPEQAELNNLDIDTRADVYSLGVILYELLTGGPPLTGAQLRGAAFDQMLRMIREVEPPKPSTRLSAAAELPSIAANRKLEPKRLTRLVHGELDWIVMKCLEKERKRRYETANGLAMDLTRYLADEPVTAGAVSAAYRFRKFVRRNKGPVLAATTIALMLVAGVIGTTWGLIRERRARATAEAREAETKTVLDFVENKVFAAARPEGQAGGLGHDVTLRKAVEAALPFVESSFAQQPLIEARLRRTLGRSFWFLGDAKTAEVQYAKARATFLQHLGRDHSDTISSTHELANSYVSLGRYADAVQLYEQNRTLQEAKLGRDHPDTLSSMNNLAVSYAALGRESDAIKLREAALMLRKAKLGPNHPDTLVSMHNLANGYSAVGRDADALKLREETLLLRKVNIGPDHPDTLSSMYNLANSYSALGRYAEALKLHDETLLLKQGKLGPDHPDTFLSMMGLARAYASLGRDADALRLFEETLAISRTKLGPDHPYTLSSMNNLANSYSAVGRHTQALKLYEETLLLTKAKLGPDHPETLKSMSNLAGSYRAADRHAEALKLHQETVALVKVKLGPDHPDTLQTIHNLSASYAALGRHAEALKLREETLALTNAKLGPDHPATLLSMW